MVLTRDIDLFSEEVAEDGLCDSRNKAGEGSKDDEAARFILSPHLLEIGGLSAFLLV